MNFGRRSVSRFGEPQFLKRAEGKELFSVIRIKIPAALSAGIFRMCSARSSLGTTASVRVQNAGTARKRWRAGRWREKCPLKKKLDGGVAKFDAAMALLGQFLYEIAFQVL